MLVQIDAETEMDVIEPINIFGSLNNIPMIVLDGFIANVAKQVRASPKNKDIKALRLCIINNSLQKPLDFYCDIEYVDIIV